MVDLPIKHGDFLYSYAGYAGYASLRSFTAPQLPQSERCAVFFFGLPPSGEQIVGCNSFCFATVRTCLFSPCYGNIWQQTTGNGGEWWRMVVNGGDYRLTPSNVDVETSMKIHPKSCKTIGEFVATMFLDLELLARQTHKFT